MIKTKKFLKPAIALILILTFGTLGYSIIEDNWSLLDSLYMTIITITTIGFGEIHELSANGRIFTIILIFFGLGLAATVISQLGQIMIESGINNMYGKRRMTERVNKLNNHFIICGYGRIGSSIATKLYEAGIDFVVIEQDETNLKKAQLKGFPVLLGDATSDATLMAAGISRAKGTVMCMNDDSANVNIALAARELNSDQNIIVRGTDPSIEYRLVRAGADTVVYPMKLGGEQIARLIASQYKVNLDESENVSSSVLGYQLQVLKNFSTDKSVQDILEDKQSIKPVAIRHQDGSMTHNPHPDTIVKHDDSLLILVNEEQNGRTEDDIIKLEWTDKLAVGISQIDDEHRMLFKYASDFQKSVLEGQDKDAVSKVFELLINYAENHFHREEVLMSSYDYPEVDRHHELHVKLTKQVMELNKDKNYIFSDSVWDFLDHWLKDHISIQDKAFAAYVQSKKGEE